MGCLRSSGFTISLGSSGLRFRELTVSADFGSPHCTHHQGCPLLRFREFKAFGGEFRFRGGGGGGGGCSQDRDALALVWNAPIADSKGLAFTVPALVLAAACKV